jgi:ketosteroid isomerase-like protein
MITLPKPIAAYVEAANAQVPARVAMCFHDDATVLDEGNVRQGRVQIEAWATEMSEQYQSAIEPKSLSEADGLHTLQALVRGNFPGSPVTLNFNFRLQSNGVQTLEIKP